MNQEERKLFEGPVDSGQAFCAGKTNDTLPPECGDSHQKEFPPSAIVKTQHCLNSVPSSSTTCSSTDEATFTGEAVLHSQRSPGGRGGHRRSLSCSREGSIGDKEPCAFCQRNGEMRDYYSSHILKDEHGLIVCPVLRAYTCPECGATGDHAHTLSHCPLSSRRRSLVANLHTRRTSCGMRVRYPSRKH